MKRFLEEERIEREKESVLPSVREEQIGGAYTLRNVVKRDVDSYIIRVGIEGRKRGGGKFRKGQALPDERDNAVASVRGIKRENARSK